MNLSVISSIRISKPVRSFIVLGIFLCAIIVFFYTRFLPENETLNSLKRQYATDLDKLRLAQIEILGLPEIEEETKQLELEYELLKKQLPEKENMPEVIKHLTEELSKLDIKWDSLIPKIEEESKKERVRETTIDIVMKPSYLTLGNYLDAIDNVPLLFEVRYVSLNKEQTTNQHIVI